MALIVILGSLQQTFKHEKMLDRLLFPLSQQR